MGSYFVRFLGLKWCDASEIINIDDFQDPS